MWVAHRKGYDQAMVSRCGGGRVVGIKRMYLKNEGEREYTNKQTNKWTDKSHLNNTKVGGTIEMGRNCKFENDNGLCGKVQPLCGWELDIGCFWIGGSLGND